MRIFAYLLIAVSVSTAAFAEDMPKSDNSAQNRGDLSQGAVTAQSQDNNKHDIKVLACVRRTIVRQKGLSVEAKNIKILCANGVITLKGPVKSEAEKSQICAAAKTCGGVVSVQDEVTVAPQAH